MRYQEDVGEWIGRAGRRSRRDGAEHLLGELCYYSGESSQPLALPRLALRLNAFEREVSPKLATRNLADRSLSYYHQGSREQLAIAEFAAALLVIPKTLSVNAGKDSTELVAKLRAYHNAAQSAAATDPKRGLRFYGLDLVKGEVRDNLKAGVLEPMVSKIKSFKSALEASTALLRIDDRVSFSFRFPCSVTLASTFAEKPLLISSLNCADYCSSRASAAG